MHRSSDDVITPLKIAIIGTGFSGTSLAAMLERLTDRPLEIYLFEKSGQFGPGVAYSSTAPFHILNVRAEDMSALEMDKNNFTRWLADNLNTPRYAGQWVSGDGVFYSRYLYGDYLRGLIVRLQSSQKIRVYLIPERVTGILPFEKNIQISTPTQTVTVDKAVLSTGNSLPPRPVFPVEAGERLIENPWDQNVFSEISTEEPVVLLGSGLTMIDSVLSLYNRQHQGKIYSLSRHGLLPLPHHEMNIPYSFSSVLPERLTDVTKLLRMECQRSMRQGNDWRSIVNGFRKHIPDVWNRWSDADKKSFLRHGQTYWNIHRHRVPKDVFQQLQKMQAAGQLEVIGGQALGYRDTALSYRQRGVKSVKTLSAAWVVNCTGPSPDLRQDALIGGLLKQGLVQGDSRGLGLQVSSIGALLSSTGSESSVLFALGSLCRGTFWEITAVPDIRFYNHQLALHLLRS